MCVYISIHYTTIFHYILLEIVFFLVCVPCGNNTYLAEVIHSLVVRNRCDALPRNVALGELYAMYSLLDAHAGNSFCLMAPPSASFSSTRFHGSDDSMAVGVVTRVVSPEMCISDCAVDYRSVAFGC